MAQVKAEKGIHFRLFIPMLIGLCLARASVADKPNFVWLISEDNSVHFMNLYHPGGAETPRIASMVESGLLYENAFSCGPVCSVARTTLMTGCYAPRIGTQFHRKSVTVPMPDGLHMFPFYLRQGGYYTSNNQKKDYNALEGEGVWDESSAKASWKNRGEGQPFFHMQSFPVTHESSLHFSREDMIRNPTETDPEAIILAPYHPDTSTFRYTYARYQDRIKQMDRQVGMVLDDLEKDGLLEETFVFYFGDHGGVLPRGKGYAYESGLHVPLVVRVPKNWDNLVRFERGSRVQGFVSFVDFGPTLLELAGLKIPESVDGEAFLGANVRPLKVNRRDEAFGYADRFDEKYDLVRTLRWKNYEYVRSFQPFNFDGLHNNYRYRMLAYQEWLGLFREGRLNKVQSAFFETRPAEALYDLDADPHETRNLAGDSEHAARLLKMRQMLENRLTSMPDLSFYPENYLVHYAFENPTQFGIMHRNEIRQLIRIAGLQLYPFEDAKPRLIRFLNSDNPIHRYWALIGCTTHDRADEALVEKARQLAHEDGDLLVRTRAAEFLSWVGAEDPRPVIMDALSKTASCEEAALILNTVVLLKDGRPRVEFKIRDQDINPALLRTDLIIRRLEYLDGNGSPTVRP